MKGADQENRETGIDAESWLVHFKELNTVNKSQFHLNNKYWNALNLCKIPEGNSYLDCNISVDEISKACLKLKNKKASGMDSILTEMLKYGQCVLLPSF